MNRTRFKNEIAQAQVALKAKYVRRGVSSVSGKRMTRMAVKKLSLEQKEHRMYLLALAVGAPFRRDFSYICREQNLTMQAARYLMNHARWIVIAERVMRDVRRKYLVQINGKAVELALLGSKYHTEMILNMENILTKKSELTVKRGDAPQTEEDADKEIARLMEECGELKPEA